MIALICVAVGVVVLCICAGVVCINRNRLPGEWIVHIWGLKVVIILPLLTQPYMYNEQRNTKKVYKRCKYIQDIVIDKFTEQSSYSVIVMCI